VCVLGKGVSSNLFSSCVGLKLCPPSLGDGLAGCEDIQRLQGLLPSLGLVLLLYYQPPFPASSILSFNSMCDHSPGLGVSWKEAGWSPAHQGSPFSLLQSRNKDATIFQNELRRE